MATLDRIELVSTLGMLKPALAKKDIIAQAQHFMFTPDEVFTYNDELYISHPLKTGLTCSVKAEEFYKILSNLTEAKVELIHKDDKLQIKSGKTNAHLSTDVEDSITSLVAALHEEEATGEWLPIAQDMLEGIFLCMFSISKDVTQGAMACVAVQGRDILSTDDVRISWFEMAEPVPEPFLLTREAATQIAKLKEITEYSITKSWVHFATKSGIVFSARRIILDFPDIFEFFEGDGVRIKLPATLMSTIQRVGVLAEGEVEVEKQISLTFDNDQVTCRGEKKGIGWIEEAVETVYKKEPLTFQTNPIFFNQVLEHSTTMKLMEGKALFSSGQFKHVIALPVTE